MKNILQDIGVLDEYEVDRKLVRSAADKLKNGSVALLAVSGKLGSGKDTIAPLVMEQMGSLDENTVHESFARPLRTEIDEVINIIKCSENVGQSTSRIVKKFGVKRDDARVVAHVLYPVVSTGEVTSAYQRTPETRKALQYWGTDVRRAQDDNYWVKRAINSCLEHLASGKSVYVTDARFPNEINAIITAAGNAIRLNITPETQDKRIWARDQIAISDNARNHISETALDTYPHFHAIIETDNLTIEEVVYESMKGIRK